MSKITIAPIGSLVNQTSFLAQLNNALQTLANGFDDTLSRDDTAPNQMEAALDMNSHTIINLPLAVNNDEAVPLGQLKNLTAPEVHITDIQGLTLTSPRNLDFIRYQTTTADFRNTRTADLPIASVTGGGTFFINRAEAEIFLFTLTANLNLSVMNWGSSGQMSRVVLQFTNVGAFNVTAWPTNTIWPSGIPPILTPTGLDLIILTTFNSGATIFGNAVGFNYS